jgi:hypothetical protein
VANLAGVFSATDAVVGATLLLRLIGTFPDVNALLPLSLITFGVCLIVES